MGDIGGGGFGDFRGGEFEMMPEEDAVFEVLLKAKVEEALSDPRPNLTAAEVDAILDARHAECIRGSEEQGA